MGLENMRFKNTEGSKEKHYPYAHEAKANNSLHSIKQGRTTGLTIAKVLGLLYLHGGLLLLLGWLSVSKPADLR